MTKQEVRKIERQMATFLNKKANKPYPNKDPFITTLHEYHFSIISKLMLHSRD